MKKIVLFLTMLVASVLVACSGNVSNETAAVSESGKTPTKEDIKTMADAFVYDYVDNKQEVYTETEYIYVFELDGVYYRAIAEMPEDVSNEIWNLDIEDYDEKKKKEREIVSSLPVETFENLTEGMPTEEELSVYVGKTGQVIFDEGWTYSYYNLEDMEAGMDYKLYSYTVKFDYDGPRMENTDDFDFEENFRDLKIASIKCSGIGDPTYIE
ncbi:MAG: hypothetical protein J6O09_00725 [Lachnospiraceae bacterium]|nr:hypothetical protein [Lachnospiraceae bacterium]